MLGRRKRIAPASANKLTDAAVKREWRSIATEILSAIFHCSL
jgi:hypothetical protein